MLAKIKTTTDVKRFAKQLIAEGVNFHPDDDFNDYVFYENNNSFYTKEQAEQRNALMAMSFEICNKEQVDIYGIMLEVFLNETATKKYTNSSSKGNA